MRKNFLFVFIFGLILFTSVKTYSLLGSGKTISPELSIASVSPFSLKNAKAIAASCGFYTAGHMPEDYTSCTTSIVCNGQTITRTGTSLCGGVCNPTDPTCPTTSCTTTDACGVTVTGTLDATGKCIPRTGSPFAINNGGSYTPPQTCTKTNACGQIYTGYICNGVCTAGSGVTDLDKNCIINFKPSTPNVNPNGSVEFTWQLPTNVKSLCGFVDLTTPTARPIPGLQNLDASTDRARIQNIQNTTRFCLVCQFYNLVSNAYLGSAAAHQWIRVVRIGEN